MKKILVTRKLLKSNEEKLKNLFDVKLNSSDELYSQEKLIKMTKCHFFYTIYLIIDNLTLNN